MKHVLPVILVALVNTFAYADHCRHPMNEYAFDRMLREVRATRSDRFQLRTAVRIAKENCLSSIQVKAMAQSLRDDEAKLRFSLRAYNKVHDPENYYDVYDAFTSFSMAFRLHDIVHGLIPNPFTRSEVDGPFDTKPRSIKFPDLDYPKSTSYNGLTGCTNIASGQQFANIAYTLTEMNSDEKKLDYIERKSGKKCLSMAQAMKLATLFNNENKALIMLKASFTSIYDMENYGAATALFRSRYLKKEWLNYAGNVISYEQAVVCEPNREQISQIKASLGKRHFPKEKLDLAGLLVKDHCFSVAQIKVLMKEFTFSSYKMEFAKIVYGNCIDPQNYYLLLDQLTFPSEKRELRRYMEDNRVNI